MRPARQWLAASGLADTKMAGTKSILFHHKSLTTCHVIRLAQIVQCPLKLITGVENRKVRILARIFS